MTVPEMDDSIAHYGGEPTFIHAYASKSSSSKRTRIARQWLKHRLTHFASGTGLKRTVRSKRNRKTTKLANLSTPTAPTVSFKIRELCLMPHYFITGIKDDTFARLLSEQIFPFRTVNVYTEMEEIDKKDGSIWMESEGVPVYILMPRIQVLHNTGSGHADVQCLHSLLNHCSNNKSKRGDKRNGISQKYGTFGVHCYRGKPGLGESEVATCCVRDYNHLKRMLNRMVLFATMYLPFGLLSILKEIKEICGDDLCLHQKQQKSSIWASIASSYNYVSPAHVDEDSFLSCLTVSYVPVDNGSSSYMYTEDMPIAVYFCFPNKGVKIGLRPGDVLFFNPLHYHCVSQRTSHYSEDEIFVTSFYMKSAQLGRNDNSIPFENVHVA